MTSVTLRNLRLKKEFHENLLSQIKMNMGFLALFNFQENIIARISCARTIREIHVNGILSVRS